MFKKYEKVFREDYQAWYEENRDYRERVAKDPRRLWFHLMPETGWMNDPNGLCQFHGIYHIYYQYTPFEPTGELKLWGHYTTKDFVHYKKDEPVLFPDSDEDAHGAYSGSALIEDDKIHFFYTGNLKYFDREDYDYINSGRGSNTLTFTSENGHDFTQKELLMTTADYPSDMSNHIRDPKVFKKNGMYYMVLGARDREGTGMVLLYQSRDLKSWSYKSRITTEEKFGYMWECPDLFELDGETVLISCPQGVASRGIDFANVHQCTAMKLSCDFEKDVYEVQDIQLMDRGFDFYAPQTFLDEKGRRILIGWMGIPDAAYTNPTTENGWQHALTIPRKLSMREGRLVQEPIEEMKQLRTGEEMVLPFDEQHGIHQNTFVYEAVVEYNQCETMEMELRDGVTLSYGEEILTLDLGKSGAGRDKRQVRVKNLKALQIFADTSSVEIFVNHGEEVFTSRIYSMEGKLSIQGRCRGKMTVYSLGKFSIEGGYHEQQTVWNRRSVD